MSGSAGTRAPIVAIVAALVALLLVADRDRSQAVPAFGRPAVLLPTADAAGTLSSTWFCAAGGSSAEEGTDVTVIIANASAETRTGTVAWTTGPDQRTEVPVEVPPLASVDVVASAAVSGSTVSAVVELDGGEVAVEHRVGVAGATAVAPCASSASDAWYLANGTTARDASQRLVLFNPFPDDAVVDISLATNDGAAEPEALQGVPVEAGATEVVELADVVRRREETAATVRARSGRLVVDRVQRFDGSEGRTGLSLTLAAPAPATSWAFPEGGYTAGVVERWHLYNPNDREALATLVLVPDAGDVPEPVDLAIPPRSEVTVEATELGRLPAGVPHFSTVRATNDVPIVVERSVDARPPATIAGWSSALGSPVGAERWVLPFGGPSAQLDEWVMVLNDGARPATVSLAALAGGEELALPGLEPFQLAPSERRAVQLRTYTERVPLPVVVEADGPVVVERVLYATAEPRGVSSVMGIPLAPVG